MITIKNNSFKILKVPARKAQKYVYLFNTSFNAIDDKVKSQMKKNMPEKEIPKEVEIAMLNALLAPENCDIMDTLLDYVQVVIGDFNMQLTDKEIDSLDLTVTDVINLKAKVLESILLPLKNDLSLSIQR